MTYYVTGGRGRLGSELVRLGCTPVECDVSIPEEVEDALANTTKQDVLFHCAAYTDVDKAQGNGPSFDLALLSNMKGTDYVRTFHAGRMILLSTDYVFSGKRGPYRETSKPEEPVNDYGYTKLAAEIVFTTPLRKGDTVVRTTGLYGGPSGRHDLVRLVRNHLQEGKALDVTKTLNGNQTYVPHLVEALMALAVMDSPPPLLNLGSREVISRYEFSLMVASVFGLDKELLHPVSHVNGWIAPRPKRGGLRVDLARRLGLPLYSIREGLEALREA